jgi:cell division protein FtsZ
MKELIHSNPELLITVVGIGGCGCNTINMLYENGLSEQVNLIAVNTDLAALNTLQVENRILIGENLTNGYGAGSNPEVGLKAAEESEELLSNGIKNSDIVIITAGFGGGTGTGASPLVARIARELNINCLAIVTLPFESEGKLRMDFALQGIKDIKDPIHAFITLSNDLLLKGLGKKVGLFSAFNQSNEVLKNLLVSLVQMLTETGYVNVDKNDFSSILSYEGESILGVGKAETEELAFDALEQALNNPLVSIANIDSAKGIIFQLFCKSEPKLSTYNGLIDHIREKITNKSVLIVPGVTLDPSLSSEIEILIVATGICSLSAEANSIEMSKLSENDSLDDDLVYDDSVCNESFSNEDKLQSYTDIPAITRKLRVDKLIGEKNV